MDERQKKASSSFPMRRIRCVNHYIRTDDSDEGGSVFRGYYEVELMVRNDDEDEFTRVGRVFFNSHAQAIAMCMARLVGDFARQVPDGIEPLFEPGKDTEMWSFDIYEYVRERLDDGSVRKSSRSTVTVKRAVGEEAATYRGIGHFGVLGIAHVIDTISRDDHFGPRKRMDIAMFRYAGKMYRATNFSSEFPNVFGRCITPGRNGEEVRHLDYHANSVFFYDFGTVVRCGKNYYLDGDVVSYVFDETEHAMADKDETLLWIANNYPNAERYSFDMETGSMDWIRKKGNNHD